MLEQIPKDVWNFILMFKIDSCMLMVLRSTSKFFRFLPIYFEGFNEYGGLLKLAIKYGHLKIVKKTIHSLQENIFISLAIKYNHLSIAKYIYGLSKSSDAYKYIYPALDYQNKSVLQWIFDQYPSGQYKTQLIYNTIRTIINSNKISLLEWIDSINLISSDEIYKYMKVYFGNDYLMNPDNITDYIQMLPNNNCRAWLNTNLDYLRHKYI
jgi:hypothetical protein